MLSLDTLPGIDYWGARAIDTNVNSSTVIAAALGAYISVLFTPFVATAETVGETAGGWVHPLLGPVGGFAGRVAIVGLSIYLFALVASHSSALGSTE